MMCYYLNVHIQVQRVKGAYLFSAVLTKKYSYYLLCKWILYAAVISYSFDVFSLTI